tara:strand:+ start:2332 stop:3135 length:804 start_codon:yes stop_codon:yes gene_type:complete
MSSTLGKVVDPLDIMGSKASAKSIKSSERLGQQSLGMQQDWMDYLKKQYEPFSEVATEALGLQRSLSGLGGEEEKQAMISSIEADPFYQAKLKAGEESILRQKSATGGPRGGSSISALAGQNQMMLGSEIDKRYNQLSGLSGLGMQGNNSLSGYGGQALDQITGTLGSMASGQLAAGAQASQRGQGIMSLLSSFSDERLKTNINKINDKNGMPWYEWEWNKTANDKFNLKGKSQGHMVSDVEINYPHLVSEKDGYKQVNYGGFNDGI